MQSNVVKSMNMFRKMKDILTNISGPNGKKIKDSFMHVF